MRQPASWLLACALAMLAHSVTAEESEDCVAIKDANERLACFDRMFPRRKVPQAPAQAEPDDRDVDVVVERHEPPARPRPADDEVVSREESKPRAETEPKRSFGLPKIGEMFGPREKVNVSSRIAAVRSREKQKMVFLLENDQIWLQSEPRELRIRTGDKVTVTSTVMGGYMLRTSNGVSTRVNRIR